MPHDLLIFGASCRAAAFSAVRCGLRPRCADYFADRDLAAVCQTDRIDSRHAARQFSALAESLPPSPWFYTGGFENRPEWVDQIARRHPLWGTPGAALRAVRDPVRVADVLHRQGIASPAVRRDRNGLPRDGTWLVKPLKSGGGRGIEPLTTENDVDRPMSYFQERIGGPSFSALFIGTRSGARLIGVTRQLTGIPSSPFAYRGSIGPLPIVETLASKLRMLGNTLSSAFGLAGWFGVDYVLSDDNPWPVEINPRYTASLEIHELASRRALLADHRLACEEDATPSACPARTDLPRSRVTAKLILYATQSLIAPEIAPDENEPDDLFAVRPIADLPWPGACFEPGEPVMTVLAAGENLAECWARVIRLERVWMSRLGIAADESTTTALIS